MSSFPKAPVTVTLTGEEWTALLIRLTAPVARDGLSPHAYPVNAHSR